MTLGPVFPVMNSNAIVYVGAGSNLGDSLGILHAAARACEAYAQSMSFRVSPIYRTSPVDSSGDDYLNAVFRFRTLEGPAETLARLQLIENQHGRVRPYHNAPRTLDLDLLMYDELTMRSEFLTLPHPRLHERAFVLRPLADLCPDLTVPGVGSVSACLLSVGSQEIARHCEFSL